MNKKRLIHGFAAFYVAFALLAAHTAVVSDQVLAISSSYKETVVAALEGLVWNHQRLDLANACSNGLYADSYFDGVTIRPKPVNRRSEYTVRIWTGDFCGGCKAYKATQVPALLKLGYTVEYKDFFKDKPPADIKVIPTIQLIYKDKVIRTEVDWPAKDLDEFVAGRLTLKE